MVQEARLLNAEYARRQMVEQQIRTYEVHDPEVLAVFAEMPREDFVRPGYEEFAFSDTSLPIGHGQFMMTPTVEGRMLQSLELTRDDDVLEIGTGTGFTAACMARLARSVVSVDIFPDFIESARENLKKTGIDNVRLATMDASKELPPERFDAIAVTCSCPLFDTRFYEALKPNGRLFIIVGNPPVMDAERIVRGGDDQPRVAKVFETNVAPMIGAARPPAFQF